MAPEDPGAIFRAGQRTRQTAHALASRWQPISHVPPSQHDPASQETRNIILAAELAGAWSRQQIEELSAEAAAARAYQDERIARLQDKVTARDEKIEALSARCERLQAKLNKPQPAALWRRLRGW